MSVWPESFQEAWKSRFGTLAPPEAEAITPFLMHRSVRSFSDRVVPVETVAALVGAAQSASTSSNLQMWSVVSVQEPNLRREVAKCCADQKHVHEAPWFFAFLADHYRIRRAAAAVGEESLGLGYAEFLIMAIIDAALAAERFACAAETIGLGICYIGGLRNQPEDIKRLLGLPHGTFGTFGMTLGWPKEPVAEHIKARLSPAAVWFQDKYDLDPNYQEYDDRMKEFYDSEAMRGEHRWSLRSGRRVDRNHLTGREVLKTWLAGQGFDLE